MGLFFKHFILISSFVILSSCSRKSATPLEVSLPTGEKIYFDRDKTFVANIGPTAHNFDWTSKTNTDIAIIYENIMRGMARFSFDKNGSPTLVPDLAFKWKTNDNLVWDFFLREEVRWSDGALLTSDHFIDAWLDQLRPNSPKNGIVFLYPILNSKAFQNGEVPASQLGIKKISNHQIRITLNKPLSFFPMLLTNNLTYPIRKDLMKKHGEDWHLPQNISVLGSFKPLSLSHDRYIALKSNPDFYQGEPKVNQLYLMTIENESTASKLMVKNELDLNRIIPERTGKEESKFVVRSNGLRTTFLVFNTRSDFFTNYACRALIRGHLNKDQLEKLLHGNSKTLDTWAPSALLPYPYTPPTVMPIHHSYNDKCFSNPKTKKPIRLTINSNSRIRLIAEAIQNQLSSSKLPRVEIQSSSWKVFLDKIQTGNFDMAIMGWNADYPHADNFYSILSNPQHPSKWINKKYVEIVDKARSEINYKTQLKYYKEAEDLIFKEAPTVPLLTNSIRIQVGKRVGGFKPNSLKKYDFSNLLLKN